MKIAGAAIQMQSAHLATSRLEVSERIEAWSGERGRPAAAPAQPSVHLSADARAAQESETAAAADGGEIEPRMKLLMTIVELLTGRPVRVARMDALREAPPASEQAAAGQARAGFGIAYDFSASYSEHEFTAFEAQGVVRTADGREIGFSVAFSMERSYTESLDVSFRAGDARLKDPLVLDFAGSAASLSGERFAFDLDADGTTEQLPMLGGGRGFLAFDRDGNGRIDDGRELFGPTSGDGFAELALLDVDGNGWIDEADPAYERLRIWQPAADGSGQQQTLQQAGVGALYLGRVGTPFELRGQQNETLGVMRSSGIYLREDGSAGTVSQIDLAV